MQSPVPTNDGNVLPWLQNFLLKFQVQGPGLGFLPAQVTATTADCNMLIYLVQTYVAVTRQNVAAALQYKDLIKNGPIGTPSGTVPMAAALPAAPATVASGVLPRLRMLVQEIKNKPAYNANIGADLGIIAAAPAADLAPPTLSVGNTQATNVTLGWSKNGWTDVRVQARAQGTVDWTDLGMDLFSPFVDTRPLVAPNTPEVREYRMCHLDGDTALLNWSAVEVVTGALSAGFFAFL